MDIERISKKIREEKDNLIAKAFTSQITSLLVKNGIVPIITEHKRQDLESIADTERYLLVYKLGVTFDSLDTSEHDKQIRAEVIDECIDIITKIMPAEPFLIKSKHYEDWKKKTTELRMLRDMLEELKEQK